MQGRAEAQLIFAGEALGFHVSASHFSIGGIRAGGLSDGRSFPVCRRSLLWHDAARRNLL